MNDVTLPGEVILLVVLVLLGPALLIGVAAGMAVRRHPGVDPASARPATAVARRVEQHTSERDRLRGGRGC